MRYHLAIDIGASSGRHILGYYENGKMHTKEVYRFENRVVKKNGHMCWEMDRLFAEILKGMRICGQDYSVPETVSVDTWGVDFVLVDFEGRMISDSVSYRDGRTDGAEEFLSKYLSEEELYYMTGIQKQKFNTIYQFLTLKESSPDELEKADAMLMIPDYFNYLLTGVKIQEYTNATTTQLINPDTCDWNTELISKFRFPQKIFMPVKTAGTVLGSLKKEIISIIGYDTKIVISASHDTASAVISIPCNEECIFISSGTWSLMGTEQRKANLSELSRVHNFTNEGGYEYRFRFLKNIMGLWMIQNVKKELENKFTFEQLCGLAEKSTSDSIVDCNEERFLAPECMINEIKGCLKEKGEAIPETAGDIARVVYRSLAVCYGKTVEEIELITGKKYDSIYIIGGGANADYLNRLTAECSKKTVYAGPVEATAIGNLAVQMISSGEIKDLDEARKIISKSFEIKIFGKDEDKNDNQ